MNVVLEEQLVPSGQRLQLVQDDLTQEAVDAIVNAAVLGTLRLAARLDLRSIAAPLVK